MAADRVGVCLDVCGTMGPGCCSGYCAAGRCRPTS